MNFPITRNILERYKTHDLFISNYDTVKNKINYSAEITVTTKPPLYDKMAEFCAEINILVKISKLD